MTQENYIDTITLAHMGMEIDIDEILLSHTQHSAQQIAIYLVQGYYRQIANTLGDGADPRLYRRALDHAKVSTIQRLPDLKMETEAALYYMLDEAERTGWMHSDFIGFDSLEELLMNSVDSESVSPSEVSDWRFVATQMIPAARRFDVEADQLFAASCQIKKLRGAIPTTRKILSDLEHGDITEEEAETGFKNVVEWVADPKVSYSQFETNIGKREPPDVFRGIDVYEVSIPGGEEWMIIPVHTETEKQIIKKMLKQRMRIKPRVLPWLIEKIQERMGVKKDD